MWLHTRYFFNKKPDYGEALVRTLHSIVKSKLRSVEEQEFISGNRHGGTFNISLIVFATSVCTAEFRSNLMFVGGMVRHVLT